MGKNKNKNKSKGGDKQQEEQAQAPEMQSQDGQPKEGQPGMVQLDPIKFFNQMVATIKAGPLAEDNPAVSETLDVWDEAIMKLGPY